MELRGHDAEMLPRRRWLFGIALLMFWIDPRVSRSVAAMRSTVRLPAVRLPRAIFLPACHPRAAGIGLPCPSVLRATVMTRTSESVAEIAFNADTTIMIPATLSPASLRSLNGREVASLPSVQVKSLTSHSLHALRLSLERGGKVQSRHRPHLRSDFEQMQRSAVLDAVRPEDLMALIAALERNSYIRSVNWNAQKRKFIVC